MLVLRSPDEAARIADPEIRNLVQRRFAQVCSGEPYDPDRHGYMQNDFGSKGGMFDRAGIDISGIQRAVGPTARVLAAARRMGIKIVYLKMGYRSDLADLGAPDANNRVLHLQRLGVGQTVKVPGGQEYRVLIRDTWGTDILAELNPHVVEMRTSSR